MSQTIDNRIVEMQFDNAEFERKAATTMSTLEKLTDHLDFSGMVDGLNDFGKSIDKVDFAPFADGLDDTSDKFTAFEAIAFGVLTRIGSAIADVGLSITSKIGGAIKDLSLGQIASGWSKYEQMAQSVATIIAATGMSEQETYEQLEKIAWFSDATSYSLNQMTDAVGKFTAAGVEMEPAVQAIEGIAGAASLAGISATDPRFNRVLYNISQAMGAGTLKLQDWMSIETANMATLELKENLIQAGLELGTLKEASDGTYYTVANGLEVTAESLRTTLKDGWATSEVMLKTFENYGEFVNEVYEYATEHGITANQAMLELSANVEDLGYRAFMSLQETKTLAEAMNAVKDAASTAWANIFQYIFGTYEEAKSLWGDFYEIIYDVFAAPIVNLRDILKLWHDLGGRIWLIEAIRDGWASITEILGTVKSAFENVFGFFSKNGFANKLYTSTIDFRFALYRLRPTEKVLTDLTDGFRGLFTILKLIKNVVSGIVNIVNKIAIKPLLKVLGGMANVLTSIFGTLGRFITGDLFKRFKESIRNLWHGLFSKDGDLASQAKTNLKSALTSVSEKIKSWFIGIPDKLLSSLRSLHSWFYKAVNWALNIDENLFGKYKSLKEFISSIKKSFSDFFDGLAKDSNIVSTFTMIFYHIQTCIESIPKLVKNVIKSLGNFFKKMGETEEVQNLITKVCGVVRAGLTRLSEYIDIFAAGLADTYPKLAEWITNAKAAVINFFKVSVPEGWKNIISWFESVKKKFEDYWTENEITNPWAKAGTIILGVLDGVLKTVANLPSYLTEAKEKIKQWWAALVAEDETAKSIDGAFKSVRSFFDGIFGWVKEDPAMQSFFNGITKFFTETIPTFPGKIADAIAKVKEFFQVTINPKVKEGWDGVSQWFEGVFSTIGGVISSVVTGIQNGWSAFVEWIKEAGPAFGEAFGTVKTAIVDFFSSFNENKATSADADETVSFLDKIKNAAESFAAWLAPFGEKLKAAGAWIGGVWKSFTKAFFPNNGENTTDGQGQTEAVFAKLKETWDKIKEPFIYVFDTITSIAKAVHDAFAGKSLTEIIQYATSTVLPALSAFLAAIGAFILDLSVWHFFKAMEGFTDIGAGYAIQLRMWARIWTTLGISIAVLVGAFILIAYMFERGNLSAKSLTAAGLVIVGIVVVLTGAIIGIAKALGHTGFINAITTVTNKFGKKNKTVNKTETTQALANIAEFILAFGIAILLISAAIFIVSKIDPDRLEDSAWTIAGFGIGLAVLSVAIIFISKNASTTVGKGEKVFNPIIGLAAVIGAFGWAMVKIAAALLIISTIKPGPLKRATDTLMELSFILGATMVLIALMNNKASSGAGAATFGLAAVIVSFAVLLSVVSKVIKQLSKIKPDALIRATVVLAGISLIFTLIIGLLGIVAKGTGVGGLIAVSFTVLAVAGAMIILAQAFESFSALDWGDIGRVMTVFGGSLAIIVGLGALAQFASIGLIALGVATLALGKGMLYLSQAAQLFATYGSAAADAIIEFFAKISVAAEEQAPMVLDAIDTWFAAVADRSDSIIDSILDILFNWKKKLRERRAELLDTGFDFVSGIIDKLTEKTPELVSKLSTFLHTLLTELQKPENVPTIVQDIVNLIGTIIENAEEAIANANPGVWEKGHKGVTMLTEILGMLGIDAIIGPAAVIGAGYVLGILTELTGIFTTFGAIMSIPGLDGLLDKGLDLFQKLGEALGTFVGSVVGNIALSISARLPRIGANLGAFADNAASFIEMVNNLDGAKMEGVGKLTDAIIKLSAAEFIDAISSWIKGGSDLGDFGKAIEEVGMGLAMFYAVTLPITDSAHLSEMIGCLSDLADVQSSLWGEGGVLQGIGGEKSLPSFAAGIRTLGYGLAAFDSQTQNITPENIDGVIDILDRLADLQSAMTKVHGMTQMWEGEQSLATFGAQLGLLGDGLYNFSFAITQGDGLHTTAMKEAADAAAAIAEVAKVIAPTGGWLQTIFGEKDLGTFGNQLEELGSGLTKYNEAVTKDGLDWNSEKIDGSVSVAKGLAGLYEYMPDVKGFWQALKGMKDLGEFGDQIGKLAAGLVTYSNVITGKGGGLGGPKIKLSSSFDATASAAAADVAKSLAELYPYMPNVSRLSKALVEFQNLDEFGTQISLLANGLVSFSKKITDQSFDAEASQSAVNIASALAELYNTLPKIPSFIQWLTGKEGGTTTLTDFGNGVAALGEGLAAFSESMSGHTNGYGKFDSSKADEAVLAAKSLSQIYDYIGSKGILEAYGKRSALSNFATEVTNLGTGLASFSASADAVTFTNTSSAVRLFKDIGEWASGLDNYAFDGVAALTDAINAFPILSASQVLSMINTYATNIRKSVASISDSVQQEGDKMKTNRYYQFVEIGKFLMEGLAKGINDNLWRVKNAIKTVNDLVGEVRKGNYITVSSPSHYWAWLGSMLILGLTNSLNNSGEQISAATDTVGNNLYNGMAQVVTAINDYVSSDMDLNPVITPVVDLDEFNRGVSQMYGNFGSQTLSASVASSVGRSIGSKSKDDSKIQNGNNTSVSMGGVTIVVNGAEGQDVNELADLVAYKLNHDIIRERAVFA